MRVISISSCRAPSRSGKTLTGSLDQKDGQKACPGRYVGQAGQAQRPVTRGRREAGDAIQHCQAANFHLWESFLSMTLTT
jgi:hypothetical protein